VHEAVNAYVSTLDCAAEHLLRSLLGKCDSLDEVVAALSRQQVCPRSPCSALGIRTSGTYCCNRRTCTPNTPRTSRVSRISAGKAHDRLVLSRTGRVVNAEHNAHMCTYHVCARDTHTHAPHPTCSHVYAAHARTHAAHTQGWGALEGSSETDLCGLPQCAPRCDRVDDGGARRPLGRWQHGVHTARVARRAAHCRKHCAAALARMAWAQLGAPLAEGTRS
jgi:hypothetical protein